MTTITTEKIEELRKLYVEMTNCDAVMDFDEVAGVCVSHKLLNRFEAILDSALLDFAQRALNANPVVLSVDDAERAMVPQPQGQATEKFYAVLNPSGTEGVLFTDKTDADFTATGDRETWSTPTIGEAFRESYADDGVMSVREVVLQSPASQLALPAGPVPDAEAIRNAALEKAAQTIDDAVCDCCNGEDAIALATELSQAVRALIGSPAVAQPVPEGAAITATGGIYYNIAEMKHQAEEAECVAMCLDDRGVPKADADGKTFSLWGRVARYGQDLIRFAMEGK